MLEGSSQVLQLRHKLLCSCGHTHAKPHVCTHAQIRHTHTHTHAHTRARTHADARTHTRARTHTCTHARARTRTHTHTHTLTHARARARESVHKRNARAVTDEMRKLCHQLKNRINKTKHGLPKILRAYDCMGFVHTRCSQVHVFLALTFYFHSS